MSDSLLRDARRKAGVKRMKTIAEASEKANKTLSFKSKADFMDKVRKQAKKQYDLDIFFEGGK
jgi:hypothetical protein